ncbi:hypothetical protein RI367_001456 [Sorochytrium milnesiophthora]
MLFASLVAVVLAASRVDSSPAALVRRDGMGPWTGCMPDGSISPLMSIHTASISPDPIQVGRNVTVAISAQLAKTLQPGTTATAEVSFMGIVLRSLSMDLCQEAKAVLKKDCPIAANTPFAVTRAFPIDPATPAVSGLTVTVTLADGGDNQLGCITREIDVVSS